MFGVVVAMPVVIGSETYSIVVAPGLLEAVFVAAELAVA